jgi:hypothetical protein
VALTPNNPVDGKSTVGLSSNDTESQSPRPLIVEFAVPLLEGDPFQNWALPEGFPFIVDDDTHEIIEPALLFLYEMCLKRTGLWNPHTARASAYALLDWWLFLDNTQRVWDLADRVDLDGYRDSRLSHVSRRTKEVLRVDTVRGRRAVVKRFYRWARERNLYFGKIHEEIKRKRI